MVEKKANELEISSIRVKYDKNDGSFFITSKDPALKGKPFALTLSSHSPTTETLTQLLKDTGLWEDDLLPDSFTVNKADYDAHFDKASPLRFYLGNSFKEESISIDFSETPHLLIAGAAGSGKTEVIKSIISQGNLRENIRFNLVDYVGKSHGASEMLSETDVLMTNLDEFSVGVNKLEEELEARYEQLSTAHVNHISELITPPPYEFLIIDNAQLSLINDYNKKKSLIGARIAHLTNQLKTLARRGRAAGIHVILSSQSISHKLIDAAFKAEFGARILMGHAPYETNIMLLGNKPIYGAPLLRNVGRGLLSIYGDIKILQFARSVM